MGYICKFSPLESQQLHKKSKEAMTRAETMEKKALDEAAKILEHVHFPKKIKLDVGGHFFSTSLETLTKDPGTVRMFEAC